MHETLAQDQVFVAADILILTIRNGRLNLLLSKRINPPYQGCWAMPGCFIGQDESAESAAGRLVEEMLPIRDAFLEQLYTFTAVGRDPRGRVVSIAYLVIIPWQKLESVLAQGETMLRCFDISLEAENLRLIGEDGKRLDNGSLAFDHLQIIVTGVQRLRGKLDYTEIGFRFLNDPELFSLSELQTIFEAILGRPQDNSNFRRTILSRYEDTGRIEATDKMEKQRRGRPAALYRMTGMKGMR